MYLSPLQALVVAGVGIETVFAQADYSGTITLGSIVLGIIVLVCAGLFTIRSNVAKVWREEAEGQKALAESEREKRDLAVAEMQARLDKEQEVRHGLKNDLAAANALLLVEKAKPDMTQLVEMMKQNYASSMHDIAGMVEGIVATQTQMLEVLGRLAEQVERNSDRRETP